MAARGDHAAAEAEYRDVLAASLRVLGPDHPSTQITSAWVTISHGAGTPDRSFPICRTRPSEADLKCWAWLGNRSSQARLNSPAK